MAVVDQKHKAEKLPKTGVFTPKNSFGR